MLIRKWHVFPVTKRKRIFIAYLYHHFLPEFAFDNEHNRSFLHLFIPLILWISNLQMFFLHIIECSWEIGPNFPLNYRNKNVINHRRSCSSSLTSKIRRYSWDVFYSRSITSSDQINYQSLLNKQSKDFANTQLNSSPSQIMRPVKDLSNLLSSVTSINASHIA